MVFIIAWKVTGEFVNPKNMTIGLYSPSLVMNAAFHQPSGLMRTLLYPHSTLNPVNRVQPHSRLISWGISGSR
jgi:hypothetical protein